MRIACIGGGPAGLYFAISMKLREPAHEIDLFERNRADDTFGWGVVFSDQTVENLLANDPVSGTVIQREFAHWDDIEVHVHGETIRSSGHGFIGIGRKRLLAILQERARALGVNLHFEHEASAALDDWAGYDLVIAADGANSRIRDRYEAHFGVDVQVRRNKFFWFGTNKVFEAFTFAFERTEAGWVWAHAYRFAEDCSTFIVEMDPETWAGLGLDRMSQAEAIALCERIFAKYLDGHALLSNAAHLPGPQAWLNFRRIVCANWSYRNLILLGDAAHTAHFSIGSGTKLALEDAIKLAEVLNRPGLAREQALAEYQAERNLEVLKLQNSARNSTEWFETLERYLHFEPIQFAYSLLTRSQRVSHENLRLRDREWLEGVERWFQSKAAGHQVNEPAPPMFAPFRLRELELVNRVVISPMAMYSAVDGTPGDFHFVHYGARAEGGAGLLYTEMTCVSPEGRITPGCAGMYAPEHAAAWARAVETIHASGPAKAALLLSHAGRRGATRPRSRGVDLPLRAGAWPLLAPSALAFAPGGQVPQALDRACMEQIRDEFVQAARLADQAGFDMLQLHMAYGYLLASFLSPLSNRRDDDYGGDLERRMRYPLEVFEAVRAAWPAAKPLAAALNAEDCAPGGAGPADAIAVAGALRERGCDLVAVYAGQASIRSQPSYDPGALAQYSDLLRNEARIPTLATGYLTTSDQVNTLLAGGRADLCLLYLPGLI